LFLTLSVIKVPSGNVIGSLGVSMRANRQKCQGFSLDKYSSGFGTIHSNSTMASCPGSRDGMFKVPTTPPVGASLLVPSISPIVREPSQLWGQLRNVLAFAQ